MLPIIIDEIALELIDTMHAFIVFQIIFLRETFKKMK